MKQKLSRDQLMQLLSAMKSARKDGLAQSNVDDLFLTFCAGCPDPVEAWRLFTQSPDIATDEELVDRALSTPPRRMAEIPASEFPPEHPLRKMAL